MVTVTITITITTIVKYVRLCDGLCTDLSGNVRYSTGTQLGACTRLIKN